MSVGRPPRIGDSLVMVREGAPRCYYQYPALVADMVLHAYEPGALYPALTLTYWDPAHRPEPGGSGLLAPLRRLLHGPIQDGTMRSDGAWLRAGEVRHRDHWEGDSWGEFWCWPEESWPGSFYISPDPNPYAVERGNGRDQ